MPSDGSMHIVLFPFLAQGHFSAFLSLADLLHHARPSATITLVSTPRNVAALRASSSAAAPFLRFHSVPFVPADHGLPADAESTAALPVRQFITLSEASESLHPGFDGFVRGVCKDGVAVCIVADVFFGWTTGVARRHDTAHAFFDSCGAFGSAVYHSICNHLPHLRTSGDPFFLPDHPEVAIHRSQLPRHVLEADGTDRWSVFTRRQISLGYDTNAILINTVEDFEGTGLGMLRRTMGVPIWPVGPLVRLPTQHSNCDDDVMRWLDAHAARSVLYVSFGSQNSIQAAQMTELAMALELTGRPFIWAIRPPVGFDVKSEFRDEWLPEGFEQRVRATSKGLLVRRWAPQVRILAHGSTCAFLSHCGWNSVLESVTHGVPIIGWPLTAEQFYNAKMLDEEWGVCVEVARGAMVGTILERAAVAEVVDTVMGETAKGIEMRRRVKEVGELINGARTEACGSSVKALGEFFASVPWSTGTRLDADAGVRRT